MTTKQYLKTIQIDNTLFECCDISHKLKRSSSEYQS